MGYTTYFDGSLTLDPQPTPEQVAYINKFNDTRRMKRNPELAAKMDDPEREAVGLPIGREAEYFVGGLGFAGQDEDESITDYNCPPAGAKYQPAKGRQPGLWCQWHLCDHGPIKDEGEPDFRLEWDGGEKFYYYEEWLEYLIEHFFEPWGIKLNGVIEWIGEDSNDRGRLVVEDNNVTTQIGFTVYR